MSQVPKIEAFKNNGYMKILEDAVRKYMKQIAEEAYSGKEAEDVESGGNKE